MGDIKIDNYLGKLKSHFTTHISAVPNKEQESKATVQKKKIKWQKKIQNSWRKDKDSA